MAHDTRSSRKIKDDENNTSKGRQSSSKGSSTSGSAASDTSGLRRSARETLLKKNITLSPSSTRKSARLEKQIPETSPFKRKSEGFEKKSTPSPLRRSDRAKSHPSTSSGSKKLDKSSGSSLLKPKDKKEKSVKELTLGTREVSKSEKQNVGPTRVKNKSMSARAYKALFTQHKKKLEARDHSEEQSRQNKFSQGGSNNCGGEVDGFDMGVEEREEQIDEEFVGRDHERSLVGSDSSVNKFTKERLEDNRGVELSGSSPTPSCMEEADKFGDGNGLELCGQGPLPPSDNAMTEEMNDAPERVHVGCPAMEKLKMPVLTGSTVNGRIYDASIGSKSSHCIIPSKRKRNLADCDSDTSAVNGSKDACTLIADVTSSLPSGSTANISVERCGACFKRQRVENEHSKLEFCSCSTKTNQELCGESVTEVHPNEGELIADGTMGLHEKLNNCMQQKEFSTDLHTNSDENACVICLRGGKLLCCEGRGCRRSYHLSCLDPPMDDVPLGVWYCSMCVRKKIESGIHSVSEGIESIWDVREVEVSDGDGVQKQEFFVKYKGLAHFHNRWIPESKLLLEAPTLVAKFNQNSQVTRWKKEWTIPRRLLQRRLLMSPKQLDDYLKEHAGDELFCHYEWLVKWHDLDYDNATWELENAVFFNSPVGQSLIRNFENRPQMVKKAYFYAGRDKILERKNCSSVKLSQLPAGDLSRFDNTCLDNVNKLRELWHKGENGVFVDAKERITKVIAFILSLQSDVDRPFLIISTSSTLCYWDDEFFRLAPSINVVVYSGNKDSRKSIRTIEFDEAGGCIMFQVLVTSPEALFQDKIVFECIGWETIIIDDCQRPRISKQLVQIKMLHTYTWLLLDNGIHKENSAEYLSLLSILNSHCSSHNGSDHVLTSSSDDTGKFKEWLSRYVVYAYKPDSSRFREYWVPVQISTFQLEQYCENLLSNSTLILSSAKKDRVGALHDIVFSARKCCDHPYIVHPPLQALLTKDLQAVEYLDVGIKASGKLRLLDMMLKEIKNQSLRVLILFQSVGGSGSAISLGDILDDFLRQRYGENSYERVESGIIRSKKDAAMNKFNNKEYGRFVFLLEARACLPSIKLSSVDIVIIFGSDWNPATDVRALQKISLDSQFEQIKVFRLYSTCTLEEKILIRAKQGKILDSHVQNISSIMLLWGAPYQFDKLDELHGCNIPASTANILPEESLLKGVVLEFCSILADSNNNSSCDLSIISKVQQSGGGYSTEVPLLSEMENQHTGEGQPFSFWTKLLEGKHPEWKYCSGLSQRNRKRVQHHDEASKKPEVGSDEVVKKRKKVGNSNDNAPYLKPGPERKSIPGCKQGASVEPADNVPRSSPRSTACANTRNVLENPESSLFESEERRTLRAAQESLHVLLKPEILKLCGILQVSDAVKATVESFLEYVMHNHLVSREPVTILQAFEISLCWTAASFLKQKINHKESLALAKQHLNFSCTKEDADYVYSMLRCLRKTFSHHTGSLKAAESPKFSNLSSEEVWKDHLHAKVSQSAISNLQKVKSEVEDVSLNQEYLAQKDISKSIKEIQKKVQKQMTKLTERQSKEKSEVLRNYQEEKEHLEREHKAESVVIRSCFQNNTSMRADKLKMLEKKIEENKNQLDLRLERLEASQLEARIKLKEKGKQWIEEVQSWARIELLNRSTSHEPEPWLGCSQTSQCVRTNEDHEEFAMTGGMIARSGSPQSVPNGTVACSRPNRTVTTPDRPLSADGALDSMISGTTLLTDFMGKNKTGNSGDVQENVVSLNPCDKELIADRGTSDNGEVLLDVPKIISTDGLQKVVTSSVTSSLPSLQELVHSPDTLPISDGEVRPDVPTTISSTDVPLGPLPLSSVQPNPDGASLSVPDGEAPLQLHETVSSSHGLHGVVSVTPPSSEDQIPVVTVSMPDKEVRSGVLETVSSNHGLGNVVLRDLLSEEHNPEKATEDETVSSNNVVVNLVSVIPPSPEEKIPEKATEHETVSSSNVVSGCPPSSTAQIDVVTVAIPDKEVDLAVAETVGSDDNLGNLASAEPPSSEEQIPEKDTEKDSEVHVIGSGSETGFCQQNGVHGKIPLVNSPGVQPVTALVLGGSVTPDQAHQDNLLATSSAVQDGDAQAGEKQITCQPVENPSPLSVATVASDQCNHELPDNEPVVQHQLLPSSSTLDHTSPQLSSANGIEVQPSSEDRIFNQVAHAPTQFIENLPDLSNQTVVRPVTCSTSGIQLPLSDTRATSVTSAFSRAIHAPQGGSRTPLSSYPDPLQYELERLNKETDQILKAHEDTKQHLKTDCDKEIQEAVAEIRRKYEMRSQEIEAEFLLKKKDLDSTHNKVLMNKILAEAFRSKCMDLRASGASGVQKDGNSSFVHQLVQLSMHDAQRHTPASSSVATPPAASLQTSIAPLPGLQTTLPPPPTNPHCTAPPTQTVPLSPAPIPSIPTRPPHISSFSPAGIPHGGGEIRAPAPHLQPFRPSTSMSNQQSHINSPTTSPSLPHIPRPQAPTQHSVPHNRAYPPENAGDLAGLRSLSALGLLMNMNSRPGANPPGILPSVSPGISDPATPGGASANSVHTGGSTDIVCLSDDD